MNQRRPPLTFRVPANAFSPIAFDEQDVSGSLRLQPRPSRPTSLPLLHPAVESKISGLRTAYVRGKASGVIETLSLHKRVFYPLRDEKDTAFDAPDHTHAVLLANNKVQVATLYARNRSRWTGLKKAPGRSSNADFLTPIYHADAHTGDNAMMARIVGNAAMDPQTAIYRNGDTYFFNATMMLMLREARITLSATDSIYVELALHIHRAVFRTATHDYQFVNFAFLLWLAISMHRPLTLPRVADILTDDALDLYYSAVNALIAIPALPFVPSTLYAVLDESVIGKTLSATVRIEATQRQYVLHLSVPRQDGRTISIDIQQNQLKLNTMVPLLGKRTVNATQDEKLVYEHIQQHMVAEAADTLDDFGIGVVEDRYVLYRRTNAADAYRWKTI